MPGQMDGRREGQKDGQTLFYRTLPATARSPKNNHLKKSQAFDDIVET